jgi:hypothetical protein
MGAAVESSALNGKAQEMCSIFALWYHDGSEQK